MERRPEFRKQVGLVLPDNVDQDRFADNRAPGFRGRLEALKPFLVQVFQQPGFSIGRREIVGRVGRVNVKRPAIVRPPGTIVDGLQAQGGQVGPGLAKRQSFHSFLTSGLTRSSLDLFDGRWNPTNVIRIIRLPVRTYAAAWR